MEKASIDRTVKAASEVGKPPGLVLLFLKSLGRMYKNMLVIYDTTIPYTKPCLGINNLQSCLSFAWFVFPDAVFDFMTKACHRRHASLAPMFKPKQVYLKVYCFLSVYEGNLKSN